MRDLLLRISSSQVAPMLHCMEMAALLVAFMPACELLRFHSAPPPAVPDSHGRRVQPSADIAKLQLTDCEAGRCCYRGGSSYCRWKYRATHTSAASCGARVGLSAGDEIARTDCVRPHALVSGPKERSFFRSHEMVY